MVINNKVSEIRNLWRDTVSGNMYPMPLEWTPDPNSIVKYEFVKTIITKIW